MLNEQLYYTILMHSLDEAGSELSFSKRLGEENGWNPDYVHNLIREYKRFIYMASVSKHPVTPSDEVDQVWHLHLLYTENYAEMCKKIGKFINHGPTKGGKKENEKFEDLYEKTKTLYRNEFGTFTSDDYWPPAETRFSQRFLRVNTTKHYVVPKYLMENILIDFKKTKKEVVILWIIMSSIVVLFIAALIYAHYKNKDEERIDDTGSYSKGLADTKYQSMKKTTDTSRKSSSSGSSGSSSNNNNNSIWPYSGGGCSSCSSHHSSNHSSCSSHSSGCGSDSGSSGCSSSGCSSGCGGGGCSS